MVRDGCSSSDANEGCAEAGSAGLSPFMSCTHMFNHLPQRLLSAALVEAARNGALSVLRTLLRAGAQAGAKCRLGYTALHCAAGENWPDCVTELLKAGASPDAKGSDGVTPLHSAALKGSVVCAELLLAAGASLGETDDAGQNACVVGVCRG